MEVKKLDFGETLKDSVAIGVKNAPSVIAAVALWLITIWIPYLNVGTTIAITLLPTQLAKGEIVNPLGIFDSKYRRYMGEFFITMGLMIFPIFIGVLFMVIPGIVLSIAWTLSYYFLIEKGKNPIQAIKASNDATYGSKWTMFFVVAGRRRTVRHRIRHFPGHLQCDRHRLHHVRRHVHPLRAGHLDLNVHQRFILETAERQRGVNAPETIRRTAACAVLFCPLRKILSKNDKYYLFFEN